MRAPKARLPPAARDSGGSASDGETSRTKAFVVPGRAISPEVLTRFSRATGDGQVAPHHLVTDKNANVVLVNASFLKFTGYSESDLLGRNIGPILQGELTDRGDIDHLRSILARERRSTAVILNYTKEGETFWNVLTIQPLYVRGVLSNWCADIVTIPAPNNGPSDTIPKLCLDDAIGLLSALAGIPKAIRLHHLATEYRSKLPRLADKGVDGEIDIDAQAASESDAAITFSRPGRKRSDGLDGFERGVYFCGRDYHSEDAARGELPPRNCCSVHRNINYPNLLRRLNRKASSSQESPTIVGEEGSSSGEESRVEFSVPRNKLAFVAETSMPTDKGRFRVRAYRDTETGAEPLAILEGEVENREGVLCRVHDQCMTSEVFGSVKCDCKQQLDYALTTFKANGTGVLVYLPQEGRGIGIANKVAAYALQERDSIPWTPTGH